MRIFGGKTLLRQTYWYTDRSRVLANFRTLGISRSMRWLCSEFFREAQSIAALLQHLPQKTHERLAFSRYLPPLDGGLCWGGYSGAGVSASTSIRNWTAAVA
jgi:hypothetical protein